MGRSEEAERARARARLPAGLEATGRDETLVRPPEVHPTGGQLRWQGERPVAGHERDV